ncbi:hypothetical protein BS47DRAFT_1358437 [Hydnum rufescens UP504]|uniref:MULE transposase domain-containing protein n=1 Tax=Hydnum rufescens UP504 TaxID=1448309 RepID=A0A9P6B854_9AGAM|nr:hypothetical protein BS47DRAFT_1358437 [Hydnum rufescens UP504]
MKHCSAGHIPSGTQKLVSWDELENKLRNLGISVVSLDHLVDISSLDLIGMHKEISDALQKVIGVITGGSLCQAEGYQTRNQLNPDPERHRDRWHMDHFKCNGTLKLTLCNSNQIICMTFSHDLHHIPCCVISLPNNIKELIRRWMNSMPKEIWKEITQLEHNAEFMQAQVYAEWVQINESMWRHDKDQVKSARILLQEANGVEVEEINICDEPGVSMLAFALKFTIDNWGEQTVKLAIDVNTNSAGYEVSAVMAEANGQGIPLGFFIHTSTNGTANIGAKEFTLSNKELSEIKAMRKVFPSTTHISCFWHATKTVEECLSENRPPAAYNPHEANHMFSFINGTWGPGIHNTGKDAELDMTSGIQLCQHPMVLILHGGKQLPIWPPPPDAKPPHDAESFCPKEYR